MTSNQELKSLIAKVEAKGAVVTVTYDGSYINTVQIAGLKGCGPFPMPAIAAAECMRELA